MEVEPVEVMNVDDEDEKKTEIASSPESLQSNLKVRVLELDKSEKEDACKATSFDLKQEEHVHFVLRETPGEIKFERSTSDILPDASKSTPTKISPLSTPLITTRLRSGLDKILVVQPALQQENNPQQIAGDPSKYSSRTRLKKASKSIVTPTGLKIIIERSDSVMDDGQTTSTGVQESATSSNNFGVRLETSRSPTFPPETSSHAVNFQEVAGCLVPVVPRMSGSEHNEDCDYSESEFQQRLDILYTPEKLRDHLEREERHEGKRKGKTSPAMISANPIVVEYLASQRELMESMRFRFSTACDCLSENVKKEMSEADKHARLSKLQKKISTQASLTVGDNNTLTPIMEIEDSGTPTVLPVQKYESDILKDEEKMLVTENPAPVSAEVTTVSFGSVLPITVFTEKSSAINENTDSVNHLNAADQDSQNLISHKNPVVEEYLENSDDGAVSSDRSSVKSCDYQGTSGQSSNIQIGISVPVVSLSTNEDIQEGAHQLGKTDADKKETNTQLEDIAANLAPGTAVVSDTHGEEDAEMQLTEEHPAPIPASSCNYNPNETLGNIEDPDPVSNNGYAQVQNDADISHSNIAEAQEAFQQLMRQKAEASGEKSDDSSDDDLFGEISSSSSNASSSRSPSPSPDNDNIVNLQDGNEMEPMEQD